MIENEIAKLEKLLQPRCSSCLYPSSASLCSSLVSVSAAFAIRPLLGKRSYGPSLARKRYARRRPPSRLRGKTFIGAPTTAVNAPRQNLHWRADDRRQRSAAKPSLARRRPPSTLRGKTFIGAPTTAVKAPRQNLDWRAENRRPIAVAKPSATAPPERARCRAGARLSHARR